MKTTHLETSGGAGVVPTRSHRRSGERPAPVGDVRREATVARSALRHGAAGLLAGGIWMWVFVLAWLAHPVAPACAQSSQFLFDVNGNLAVQHSGAGLPPQFVAQPRDQAVSPGASATFTVVVADPRSMTYQWQFNEMDLVGATGASLVIESVRAEDEGRYRVVLTNPSGSVASATARLWIDDDGDGMADSWELAQFGNLNQNATGDADGDRVPNLREFRDGTDPQDPNSARYRLRVIRDGGIVFKNPDQGAYDKGQVVQLSAQPLEGDVFHAWLGDIVSRENPVSLVMTNDTTIFARFTPIRFTWTNTVGGNWESASNWFPNLVPGFRDRVQITNAVSVALNTDVELTDITLSDPRTELKGDGMLTVTENFSWSRSTMSGGGRTILEAKARMDAEGDIKLIKRVLENRGVIEWHGPLFVVMGGAIVTNAPGAVFHAVDRAPALLGGGLAAGRFDNGGEFRMGALGGSIDFSNGLNFLNAGSVEVVTNVLNFGGGFTNHGTVALSPESTLRLPAGGSASGVFSVPPTALVEWTGGVYPLNAAARLEGGGLYRIRGTAEVVADADLTVVNLEMLSGTLRGGGTLTIATAMNWSLGTMSGTGRTIVAPGATLTLATPGGVSLNQRTLENAGTVVWSGAGPIGMNFSSVITNRPGALFQVLNATPLSSGAGINRFDNAGLFLKSVHAGVTTLNNVFNNTGTVTIETGTLLCNGAMNNGGTIALSAGTTNRMAGGGSAGGVFTVPPGSLLEWSGGRFALNPGVKLDGAGLYRVDGIGTVVEGNTDVTALNLDLQHGSSTWTGGGNLTVVGAMNWSAGTMEGSGRTIIAPGAILNVGGAQGVSLKRILENGGEAIWTGNGVWILLNGVVTNRAGAVFNAQNNSRFHFGGGGCRVDNAGIFRKSVGTGVTEIGVGFANFGTLELRSGILSATRGFTSSTGARLVCVLGGTAPGTGHGQLQVAGAVALAGTLEVGLLPGFVPALDDTFTVVTAGSRTGSFSPFVPPADVVLMQLSNAPNAVIVRTIGFPVSELVMFPPIITRSNVTLLWTGAPNRTYRLEFNAGLETDGWFPVVGELITVGDKQGIVDPLPATNRFYRVRVVP